MAELDEQLVNDLARKVALIALHDTVHTDQWITSVIGSVLGEGEERRVAYQTAVARRLAAVDVMWPERQDSVLVCGNTTVNVFGVELICMRPRHPEDPWHSDGRSAQWCWHAEPGLLATAEVREEPMRCPKCGSDDTEDYDTSAEGSETDAKAEPRTCAHCQRDLTGASIHTIQGIDVCADIRHCLARQSRFAERIAELGAREVKEEPQDVRPGHGPGVPGAMHLEAFGQSIADAFGECPYHVGSSLMSKQWRDVDVRLILDDERFAALFPGFATAHHVDAWWSLFCAAMSELGRVRTGLPVDFQVQSMSEANENYPGFRNPLMLIPARDENWPRMDARNYGEEFQALLRSGESVSEQDQAALAEALRAAGQEQPGCGRQCSEMHTYEPGRCEAAVPDPARYFESGRCRICGVQFGGNHLFMCGNGMADDVQHAEARGAVKRTPDEWCREYGIEVHDPDGWRHPDAPAWEDPITLADFYKRAWESSVRNLVTANWSRIAHDAREADQGESDG